MILAALIFAYVTLVVSQLLRSEATARRLASLPWEELRDKLGPVNQDDLNAWKSHYKVLTLDDTKRNFTRSAQNALRRRRLRQLKSNSLVMIALASWCNNWNPESSIQAVAEMKRHEGRLRKAVRLYQISVFLRRNEAAKGKYLAAMSNEYGAIVERLLYLYKTTHVGRYLKIRAACS